jgi:hypothetical protein
MRAATEHRRRLREGIFDERRLYRPARASARVPSGRHPAQGRVHKLIQAQPDVYLGKDYLFRYDPDWFWNIPQTAAFRLFRRLAPARLRSSPTTLHDLKHAARERCAYRGTSEPRSRLGGARDQAAAFTRFALHGGSVRPPVDRHADPHIALAHALPGAGGYAVHGLGCCCASHRARAYWYTRIMDAECFARGGVKMLYSSTFLSRDEFDRIYNGAAYAVLKARYDPAGRAATLFEKAVHRSA